MKGIFKRIAIVLLILLVASTVLFLAFNKLIARHVLQSRIEAALGLKVKIESLEGNIFSGKINVRGLQILNQETDVIPELLVIPLIELDIDMSTFFSGTVHFLMLKADVARFNVVLYEDGQTNIDHLPGHITALADRKDFSGLMAGEPRAVNDEDAERVPFNDGKRRITVKELQIELGRVELHGVAPGGERLPARLYPVDHTLKQDDVDALKPVGEEIMTVLFLRVLPELENDLKMMRRALTDENTK